MVHNLALFGLSVDRETLEALRTKGK